MAFKLALIFATLAYASAVAIDSGVHHAYNQHHPQLHHGHQAISYADHTQGHHLNAAAYFPHSYAAGVPAQVYSAPITKTFAAVPTPAVGHGYAHTIAHGRPNYGYSGHGYNFAAALPHGHGYGYATAGYGAAAPLTTYGHGHHGVVAPVVADHTYAHGGHQLAYNNHHGHYVH